MRRRNSRASAKRRSLRHRSRVSAPPSRGSPRRSTFTRSVERRSSPSRRKSSQGGASLGTVAAAQFTFGARTYVAIDQINLGIFVDTDDLLIDITGATGTISTTHFV